MSEQHNEQLFREWWDANEKYFHRVPTMDEKNLAKAAFLAGRQSMMPTFIEEAEEE